MIYLVVMCRWMRPSKGRRLVHAGCWAPKSAFSRPLRFPSARSPYRPAYPMTRPGYVCLMCMCACMPVNTCTLTGLWVNGVRCSSLPAPAFPPTLLQAPPSPPAPRCVCDYPGMSLVWCVCVYVCACMCVWHCIPMPTGVHCVLTECVLLSRSPGHGGRPLSCFRRTRWPLAGPGPREGAVWG